jgi:Putative zinc-finger
MDLLVDYHFGRLSPEINAAVEAHVRDCAVCQRQGLAHAPTEKRQIMRRLRKVRPARALVSRRGRTVLLLLIVLLIVQLVVFEVITQGALFSLFAGGPAPAGPSASTTATSPTTAPAQSALASSLTFDKGSTGATALAVSPDGKIAASAGSNNSGPSIQLWSVSTGKLVDTLAWPDADVPGTLAWSADSSRLAAADGSFVAAWTVATGELLWNLQLPKAPAVRIYDVQAGGVIDRPDPATTFANGAARVFGADGKLIPAPATAGLPGVGQSAAVGLWQAAGSHVFASAKGSAAVGISTDDAAHRLSLLNWSHDGRFLLWATVSQPVAVSADATHGGPPNALAARLATAVASAGASSADGLAWFSPDGRDMVVCDRTASSAPLRIYDIASERVLATLAGGCDGLTTASLAWLPGATGFALAAPGKPVALYALAPAAG